MRELGGVGVRERKIVKWFTDSHMEPPMLAAMLCLGPQSRCEVNTNPELK